ncbi:MAG: PIN domain-containing protein [Frankiaceae bacterium]|nr:PIN domain-containing protein [Frankiaceae bacterium]
MARRLILDTGVLGAAERARASLGEVVRPDDDVAIAAVSVAELRTGVELASANRRDAREAFLEQVLRLIPVESYDVAVAQVHGSLLAVVHRDGVQRGAHDLIIAATAAATKRTVVTLDRGARFGDLPGVECLELS